jgi:RNA polymerase sigma factor (TIGR02999 family)
MGPSEVTQLLIDWRNGDRSAVDKLMPIVYGELRRLARHYMDRERPGHTLQTTALVNEAYCKLLDHRQIQWQNRTHFFAIAAQVMRRLLVDHARTRRYAKRGGGARAVPLDEVALVTEERADVVLAVDAALSQLATLDLRKSQIVELRYFGGLTTEETADVLGVAPITIKREWLKAKAWLQRELNERPGDAT